MTGLAQDLRVAARGLGKSPAFTAVTLLILALGIGANSALFSVVDAVLLRRLPFTEPEKLVALWVRRADTERAPLSLPELLDYQKRGRALAGIAGLASWNANLTGTGEPERLQGVRISANAFQMLGVAATVGRTLVPADDDTRSPRVVVLTHGLWKRRFGGDPGIVGRDVTLNGEAHTVVGVLPRGFLFFNYGDAEVAVPLRPGEDPLRNERGSTNFLRAIARLAPGISRAEAEASLNVIAADLRRQYPVPYATKLGIRLFPLADDMVGSFRTPLLLLLGSVGVVLLIACANLANLLLARATAHQRETAIRTALGASRARLIRLHLAESLLLALVGGAAGLVLAGWATRLLVALGPANLPRAGEIGLDARVLAFTLGLSLLTGVLFGVAPALQVSGIDPNEELKSGGRGSSDTVRRGRVRTLLVIAEVALSLVLLTGAGLLLRSFARVQAVDPGYEPERLLTARLSLPKAPYGTRAKANAFYERLSGRIAALPGVEAVGAIHVLPLTASRHSVDFTIDGRPAFSPNEVARAQYRYASPGFFRAMRTPVKAGREFTSGDTERSLPAVVVSETLAARHFPKGDAIGSVIRIDDNDKGPRPVTIVGVVGDVKQLGLDAPATPDIYVPYGQVPDSSVAFMMNMYLVIRTAGDPSALAAAVPREIAAVDPGVAASNVGPMTATLEASMAPRRFSMLLLQLFAAVALLLSATGLYAVISYGVARRTHEIGIRMALGAKRSDVVSLVVGQGARLVAVGLGIGLAAALALARLFSGFLFGISASDPATYAGISLLLAVVSLAACLVPAARATRIAPVEALRGE